MTFTGFPKESVSFFINLRDNNTKTWFDNHRADYEQHVMEPARDFVEDMGMRLRELSPQIVADARVNQSIFKIHRDVRFSRDKTPFKTNLAMIWWEGRLKKLENSCYYFHLEPPNLLIGTGIYIFPKPHLEIYRESVIDPKHGVELAKAVENVQKNGYNVGQIGYKSVPRGYDPAHERAALLKYKGMAVGIEIPIPNELYSAALLDFCFEHYKNMYPLHHWLVDMTERMSD